MRSSLRVRNLFLAMVFPALCAASFGYFAYYTVCGPRGLMALYDTNANLSVRQEKLQALADDRGRLQHNIELLSGPHPDPDLIEELARRQMIGSTQGQVDVPR